MARRILLAALLVIAVWGCNRSADVPEDPTSAALHDLRTGKFDSAITQASRALTEEPNNAAAYLYRGRAYHSRNAMGDHQRAIEDFGEAIRLAPESSDAYYSRGLVYRDLGQNELADADETQARKLDSLAQQVYKQLPDVTPPDQIAAAPSDEAEAKQEGPKSASQMLRETAGDGFGEIDSLAAPPSGTPTASASGQTSTTTPLGELSRSATSRSNTEPEEQNVPATDAFGRPLTTALPEPAPTYSGPMSIAPSGNPSSLGGSGFGVNGFGTGQGTGDMNATGLPRASLPTPQSPFSTRAPMASGMTPGMTSPGMMPQQVLPHSPFTPQGQQATRGATGYVRPVNPFGAQSGAGTISRPFSTPVQPYNNRVVRPFNARDY